MSMARFAILDEDLTRGQVRDLRQGHWIVLEHCLLLQRKAKLQMVKQSKKRQAVMMFCLVCSHLKILLLFSA